MGADMTIVEATARLEAMCAADYDPALTDADIARILAMAARPDEYDLAPTDDGWTPTYDMPYAAAEAWRWKAARVAERVGFNLDGGTVHRQHLFTHCMEMARFYSRGIAGTVEVGADTDD